MSYGVLELLRLLRCSPRLLRTRMRSIRTRIRRMRMRMRRALAPPQPPLSTQREHHKRRKKHTHMSLPARRRPVCVSFAT